MPSVCSHGAHLHARRHYVTIIMRAEMPQVRTLRACVPAPALTSTTQGQEAVLLEPDKCAGWCWVAWPHVPAPVFQPLQQLIASGYTPFGPRDQA